MGEGERKLLAARLHARATQISQELSIRETQQILQRVCGFHVTAAELLADLGCAVSDRVSFVPRADFAAVLVQLTSALSDAEFNAAIESEIALFQDLYSCFVPNFKRDAPAEAFIEGAWVECVVRSFDEQTCCTRVEWQNDDGNDETVVVSSARLRCLLLPDDAVEAMDATGHWWPATVLRLYEDDEIDLLVHSPFDQFEVSVVRSSVRTPNHEVRGYISRPFAEGEQVFAFVADKWQPGSVVKVDDFGLLTVVADSGNEVRGLQPQLIRSRFAAGERVEFCPDLQNRDLCHNATIIGPESASGMHSYRIEVHDEPAAGESDGITGEQSPWQRSRTATPHQLRRQQSKVAEDARLFWNAAAAGGASSSTSSWAVTGSGDASIVALPPHVVDAVRMVFLQEESIAVGSSRDAVDYSIFANFYFKCTAGVPLQADQRRDLWARLGQPSTAANLATKSSSVGGDVEPDPFVLRLGLGEKLYIDDWLALATTLLCLGADHLHRAAQEYSAELFENFVVKDLPLIEVRQLTRWTKCSRIERSARQTCLNHDVERSSGQSYRCGLAPLASHCLERK